MCSCVPFSFKGCDNITTFKMKILNPYSSGHVKGKFWIFHFVIHLHIHVRILFWWEVHLLMTSKIHVTLFSVNFVCHFSYSSLSSLTLRNENLQCPSESNWSFRQLRSSLFPEFLVKHIVWLCLLICQLRKLLTNYWLFLHSQTKLF